MAKKCLSKKSPSVKAKHSKIKSGGGKKPKVGSPKVGECKGAKKSSMACHSKMTPKRPKSRSKSSKDARNVALVIVDEVQHLFANLGVNLKEEKKEPSKKRHSKDPSSKKSKEFFEIEVTTQKIKGSKSKAKFSPLTTMSPTKQEKPHSKPKTNPKKKSAKSKKKSNKKSKKAAKSPSEKATTLKAASKKEASKKH